MQAEAKDFFFSGFLTPGNTSNPVGSYVTPVNVMQIPGLNTLGISMVRVDYAPYGLNPPHTHPRATEMLVVLEGSLYVGFVTSNQDNRLFTKVLFNFWLLIIIFYSSLRTTRDKNKFIIYFLTFDHNFFFIGFF